MGGNPAATKRERVIEYLRRLGAAPAASNFDEAYRQIGDILNAVEDEMTPIPYDPALPLNDGRMYPPQDDSKKLVPGRPDVTRYRSKGHGTLIGENGAIQVIDQGSGEVVLDKPGADGNKI